MPNITVHTGVHYEPGKEPPGWVPPVADEEAGLPSPPPVSAPKAEHAAYVAEALGVPAEEAEAMRKADLVELARSAAEQAPAPVSPPRMPPRRDLPPDGA